MTNTAHRIKTMVTALLAAMVMQSMTAAYAGEEQNRIDHFQAIASKTLTQAVENLSTHNEKLSAILQKDTISAEEMNDIHEITYTLENALQKMQSELSLLAVALKEVHLGSEQADNDRVKTNGKRYLEGSQALTHAVN